MFTFIAIIFFIIPLLLSIQVKGQATSSGDVQSGWGVNILNGVAIADSTVLMGAQRAADSIASIKTSLALKIGLTALSLTTTGTSGAASYSNVTGIFNIPQYAFTTNAKADNSTKGIATFNSTHFTDDGAGLISWSLNYGTGSVSAGAVTINTLRGKITYTSPSIVAAGTATFTFTNNSVTATSTIIVGINGNGSNLTSINCYIKSQTSGSCVIAIQNLSLLSLFNTNMIVDFMIIN